MNKELYAFKRRSTSSGFFNTQQDKKNQRVGHYVPYQQRKLVSDDEKSAHFLLGSGRENLMISENKHTFQKHELDKNSGNNCRNEKKIRKTNFKFGSDSNTYNQTTQQYNNNLTLRCNSAKGVSIQKPVLDREKIQSTQFKMGFLTPNYETTAKEYSLTGQDMPRHKILEKGMGKDTSHNFTYGNTKIIYKSSNTDSYKNIDLKKSLKNHNFKSMHGSHIGEHQRKQIELTQKLNKKHLPHKSSDKNTTQKFKSRQSFTPRPTDEMSKNLRKTHFTFGNSNEFKQERSLSPYLQGFNDILKDHSIASRGKLNSKTTFNLGLQKAHPFQSSYQQNHKSIKPGSNMKDSEKHMEMSNKRMRESKVFQGKALDAVNLHNTKPETSYKVAVATGKQEKVIFERGKSSIHLGSDKPNQTSETKDKFLNKPGSSKIDSKKELESVKAKMQPHNLFNYRKSMDHSWMENFKNNSSKIDPKLLSTPANKELKEKLHQDLKNSHLQLGTQKSQFTYLKNKGLHTDRSSTALSTKKGGYSIGFTKKLLPKDGVQLGLTKPDLRTSNQMFYQWIQPHPTNLR